MLNPSADDAGDSPRTDEAIPVLNYERRSWPTRIRFKAPMFGKLSLWIGAIAIAMLLLSLIPLTRSFTPLGVLIDIVLCPCGMIAAVFATFWRGSRLAAIVGMACVGSPKRNYHPLALNNKEDLRTSAS